MRLILGMLLCISLCTCSCAQSHQIMTDSLPISPGTIRVVGVLKRLGSSQSATLKIIQIVAQGQGIVNILSEGDEVIVKLSEENKNIINNKNKVEAYLKEGLGADASRSTYILVGFKELKK